MMAARSRSDIRLQIPSHDCVESSDWDTPDPSRGGLAEGIANPSDKALGGVRNVCETDVAVRSHDVGDRRGDDWLARGEVLRRFRRTDVPGRGIESERHHRDVPPRDVARQIVIRLRPEVVDVLRPWQVVGTDLGDGPDQHEGPPRRLRRDRGEKITIESFIEDPKESNSGLRNRRLIRRIVMDALSRRKVLDIDTARKLVHVLVQPLLRRVETVAPGENEVCPFEKRRFRGRKLWWRPGKGAEFIHAVVHHGTGTQVVRKQQRHRGVVPEHQVLDALPCKLLIEQADAGR